MIMDWFGYELSGVAWVGPVLGTFVFLWGGWPFLKGAADEVRDRAPGMMLLIAMAITVAWASSMASSLGWFDLEFWWELAALVTIMLLGHWLGLLLVALAIVVTFGYRVRLEERALLEALGEPYADYMRRTKRFIPYLW